MHVDPVEPKSIAITEFEQSRSEEIAWRHSPVDGGTMAIRVPEGALETILGHPTLEGAFILVTGVNESGPVEVTVRNHDEAGAVLVDGWQWAALPVTERDSRRLVQRRDRHWVIEIIHKGKKFELDVQTIR